VNEDDGYKVIEGAYVATPFELHFDTEVPFEDFTQAMLDLTFATQTATFQINDLSAALIKLMTGFDFSWRLGVEPMVPGMVTWDGRRRRKRRKP